MVPDLAGFCFEVAVTVNARLLGTDGAVRKPAGVIVPSLAVHVTAELNFPKPSTTAEH